MFTPALLRVEAHGPLVLILTCTLMCGGCLYRRLPQLHPGHHDIAIGILPAAQAVQFVLHNLTGCPFMVMMLICVCLSSNVGRCVASAVLID